MANVRSTSNHSSGDQKQNAYASKKVEKKLKKGYDVLERDTSSMLPLPMLFNLASCEVWLAALPWKGFDTRAVSLAKIL